jgi:hypothetical protein
MVDSFCMFVIVSSISLRRLQQSPHLPMQRAALYILASLPTVLLHETDRFFTSATSASASSSSSSSLVGLLVQASSASADPLVRQAGVFGIGEYVSHAALPSLAPHAAGTRPLQCVPSDEIYRSFNGVFCSKIAFFVNVFVFRDRFAI